MLLGGHLLNSLLHRRGSGGQRLQSRRAQRQLTQGAHTTRLSSTGGSSVARSSGWNTALAGQFVPESRLSNFPLDRAGGRVDLIATGLGHEVNLTGGRVELVNTRLTVNRHPGCAGSLSNGAVRQLHGLRLLSALAGLELLDSSIRRLVSQAGSEARKSACGCSGLRVVTGGETLTKSAASGLDTLFEGRRAGSRTRQFADAGTDRALQSTASKTLPSGRTCCAPNQSAAEDSLTGLTEAEAQGFVNPTANCAAQTTTQAAHQRTLQHVAAGQRGRRTADDRTTQDASAHTRSAQRRTDSGAQARYDETQSDRGHRADDLF